MECITVFSQLWTWNTLNIPMQIVQVWGWPNIPGFESIPWSCRALMKIGRKRIGYSLLNEEAVCRTAPATPGLLNIINIVLLQKIYLYCVWHIWVFPYVPPICLISPINLLPIVPTNIGQMDRCPSGFYILGWCQKANNFIFNIISN